MHIILLCIIYTWSEYNKNIHNMFGLKNNTKKQFYKLLCKYIVINMNGQIFETQ